MAHPKRITASEWQQWPLRHQLSKRANVLGTREAKSGKSVATFARILRNTWRRGALHRKHFPHEQGALISFLVVDAQKLQAERRYAEIARDGWKLLRMGFARSMRVSCFGVFRAFHRSVRLCVFSQKSAELPNTRARIRAVSAVTARRSRHSSLTCLRGSPLLSARLAWVRPRGSINS